MLATRTHETRQSYPETLTAESTPTGDEVGDKNMESLIDDFTEELMGMAEESPAKLAAARESAVHHPTGDSTDALLLKRREGGETLSKSSGSDHVNVFLLS